MTRFDPKSPTLLPLADSVVVLTGGATGIGAATVSQLASLNAKVIFGDVASPSDNLTSLPNVTYVKCDVTIYQDIIKLFDTALDQHGKVDHAVSIAGVTERGGWFDSASSIEGVRTGPPEGLVMDVNARGPMWFAQIAVQYLAHGVKREDGYSNKSLTLVASIASWLETPGIPAYQCSKHAVLGLLRALRLYLPGAFGQVEGGIRINCISPSMTDTRMVDGIREGWVEGGHPVNQPADVARVIVGVSRAGKGSQSVWYDGKEAAGVRKKKNWGGMDWDDDEKEARGMSGRNWVVVGGEAWDMEEGLDRTMDSWLGESVSEKLKGGQEALGVGKGWTQG